jgi:RNA polymerase sigma factor (sigma-70 family)
MNARHPNAILQYLRLLVHPESPTADLTDGHLLHAFTRHQDRSAFESLLRRHGPMVLGVCRRLLRDEHQAEDAFQATFLLLLRKASAIKKHDSVGSWLYGVAVRTALRARERSQRLRMREAVMDDMSANTPDRTPDQADLRAILDEELRHLPDRYRTPIVLYYLEGHSTSAVAELLHCPLGTIVSRLTRARALLRRRLTRRGLTTNPALLAAALTATELTAAVPAELLQTTTEAALLLGSNEAAIAANVTSLMQGVMKDMWISKLRILTGLLLGLTLLACGVGVVLSAADQPQPSAPAPAAEPKPLPKETPLPSELALVPSDGLGFVSIRVKEFVESPLTRDVYKQMRKNPLFALGLKMLKMVHVPINAEDSQAAGLTLENLDRVTMILGPITGGNTDVLFLATTFKPFKDDYLKKHFSMVEDPALKGKIYYLSKEPVAGEKRAAIYCPRPNTLLMGYVDAVKQYMQRDTPEKERGALHGGLRLAVKNQLLLAVNPAQLRGFIQAFPLPDEVTKVLQPFVDADALSLSLTLDKEIEANLFLTFADDQTTKTAMQNLSAALDTVRTTLPATIANLEKTAGDDPEKVQHQLKVLKQLNLALKGAPVRQEGKRLHLPLQLKIDAAALVGAVSELVTAHGD